MFLTVGLIIIILCIILVKYLGGDFVKENKASYNLQYRIVETIFKGSILYEIQISKDQIHWEYGDTCHSFEVAEKRINELLFPQEPKVLKYYEKL